MITNAALVMVRVTGVEPARIAPPEPKSGAYANFAIPALLFYYNIKNEKMQWERMKKLMLCLPLVSFLTPPLRFFSYYVIMAVTTA